MLHDVPRPGLYRGRINLWVEDKLSREYLSAIWNDPDIAFLIAGGNEGVKAIVNDSKQNGYPNVFGLIDRDFLPSSNQDEWGNPHKTFRTFILPAHEIENYLLDPAALAASRLNTLKLTESQIQCHLERAAAQLVWWISCRSVVANLRHRFRNDFMTDPGRGSIQDETDAINHFLESDWFRRFEERSREVTEPKIRELLTKAHQSAASQLTDGSWKVEFSGKEVFRDVGSRICDRTRIIGRRPTSTEFDIDLAKGIADWQVERLKVPKDLTDLRRALRDRVAKVPS